MDLPVKIENNKIKGALKSSSTGNSWKDFVKTLKCGNRERITIPLPINCKQIPSKTRHQETAAVHIATPSNWQESAKFQRSI